MSARKNREIIVIDEEKCDGCGQCVPSCDEGAIQIINGKAKLVRDDYCDGLGACLTECPQGALTIEKREADDFDPAAVSEHLEGLALREFGAPSERPAARGGGCPGSATIDFRDAPAPDHAEAGSAAPSELRQWPIQLHLVSPAASYFQGADLLIAADCVPFSIADFHPTHLKGKSLVIACPKLDSQQEIYRRKLSELVESAGVASVTVMIMQVPCCGGLFQMAREAVESAGRKVPLRLVVAGIRGDIVEDTAI